MLNMFKEGPRQIPWQRLKWYTGEKEPLEEGRWEMSVSPRQGVSQNKYKGKHTEKGREQDWQPHTRNVGVGDSTASCLARSPPEVWVVFSNWVGQQRFLSTELILPNP